MFDTPLFGRFVVILAVLLGARAARAQDQSTDPTELVENDPVVALPHPDDDDEQTGDGSNDEDQERAHVALPGDPWGDVGPGSLLSLRALFRMRYRTTFSDPSDSLRESYRVREEYLVQRGDGYALNRMFVRIGSDPSAYLSFKAVFDFAELWEGDPEDVVRQAYATLRIIPKHLELVAGMFKIPFSTLELDASSRFEFTEMGESNGLVNRLGFAGQDLGVQLLMAPLRKAKRLRLTVGAFRGRAKDELDSPVGSVAARVELKPHKTLRFGADFVQHLRTLTYDRPFETSGKEELPDPPDPRYPAQQRIAKGRAASVDVRFKKKGFMLRGEGLYGDRIDLDERYGARTFWAAWGILAYRIEAGSVQLLPALRAEWLDANREQPYGVQRQLAGGITVLFLERVRFVVDVMRTDVQANTPRLNQPKPLQREPYLALDHFQGTAQIQVEL